MKAVTVKELDKELILRTPKELRELCLRLSRFKKENKELLTYLLFESSDEELYIEDIKKGIDDQFEQINKKSPYFIKKSLRKILSDTKKFIRYSQVRKTETELLIYYCYKLRTMSPSIKRSVALVNLYNRQVDAIAKKVSTLHEDLQYDYVEDLKMLNINL